MSAQNYLIPDHIYDYVQTASLREPAILQRLRQETADFPKGGMQVAPEFGQLLGFLVGLTGARRALELGTFTGYSALRVALALPEDGRLVACDGNEEALAVARRYWAEAGVDGKIDLRVGEIADTLPGVVADYGPDCFDFAFIDADKLGYANYYETGLKLLRRGGLMVFDNVLMGAAVTDPNTTRKHADAMRTFNMSLRDDDRIGMTMLAISDGVTLAYKR